MNGATAGTRARGPIPNTHSRNTRAREGAATNAWLGDAASYRDSVGSTSAQAWLMALGGEAQDEIIELPMSTRSTTVRRLQSSSLVSNTLLVLFPNPASDGFRAAYRLPADLDQARFAITDVTGRELWSENTGTGVQVLDVPTADFPDGLYLCRIEVEGMAVASERIIITR